MQYIISTLLLAGFVLATPEAPVSNGAAPYPAADGPYPPSGWKPSGRLLVLPAKQVAQVYGIPSEYGPPSSSTEADPATTDYPSTTPQQDESASPAGYTNNGFPFEQLQQQPGADHGIYHVLLPDGRLQRVEYVTAPLKASEQSSNVAAQQSGNYQQEQNKYQNQYAQQYQYQQGQNGKYEQAQYSQQQYPQQPQYQQSQSGKFQQGQYEQAQYPQEKFQQYPQQSQYQQSQSGKFQQGQFEQTSYPQPAQPFFPGSFPKPVYQPTENSKYQQAQFSGQNNNYQSSQYQQAQSGKYQQGQNEPTNYIVGYVQPQSEKYTQNKNQAQTQYPQLPDYESNASQNQFNQKKYNKQQGSNANNQNKQVSTNVATSSANSSRFTNANAPQQPTQEYQPVYYAQQQSGQEAPAFAGFVANVQYKDVEPIATPVYTYNPAPLVRILRKTE